MYKKTVTFTNWMFGTVAGILICHNLNHKRNQAFNKNLIGHKKTDVGFSSRAQPSRAYTRSLRSEVQIFIIDNELGRNVIYNKWQGMWSGYRIKIKKGCNFFASFESQGQVLQKINLLF